MVKTRINLSFLRLRFTMQNKTGENLRMLHRWITSSAFATSRRHLHMYHFLSLINSRSRSLYLNRPDFIEFIDCTARHRLRELLFATHLRVAVISFSRASRFLYSGDLREADTTSSMSAAWARSIYGPWGSRVQVPPPPLRVTLGESTLRSVL